MAGIGFELQRLVQRDDLSGAARGYLYAAVIVAGPWLLTVAAIAIVSAWADRASVGGAIPLFRTIILYNFAVSLVLTAPIAMITTRFLADRIYDGDERETTGALAASVIGAMALQAPVPLVLYFSIAQISPWLALIACANYFAVAALWVAAVFLSTLKEYLPVALAFLGGITVSVLAAILLRGYGAEGLMAGFTLGIVVTLCAILGRTVSEFRADLRPPRQLLGTFRAFPALAVTALAYNAAIWIDKWFFWLSPALAEHVGGLPVYPPYDGAMFYAHLTLAPGLAVFFALVETSFYTSYRSFYWRVQHHGTLHEIEQAQADLIATVSRGARTLLSLHVAIALVAILLSPAIANALALMPGQIGIFRFAVLGTAAHAFFLYALILLSYFDLRRWVVGLSVAFLALNAGLTAASQYLDFAYLGSGYFLAALISAAAAVTVAHYELKRLRYLTFVANNPATGRAS